jgi:hypothetical protein
MATEAPSTYSRYRALLDAMHASRAPEIPPEIVFFPPGEVAIVNTPVSDPSGLAVVSYLPVAVSGRVAVVTSSDLVKIERTVIRDAVAVALACESDVGRLTAMDWICPSVSGVVWKAYACDTEGTLFGMHIGAVAAATAPLRVGDLADVLVRENKIGGSPVVAPHLLEHLLRELMTDDAWAQLSAVLWDMCTSAGVAPLPSTHCVFRLHDVLHSGRGPLLDADKLFSGAHLQRVERVARAPHGGACIELFVARRRLLLALASPH